MEASEPPHVGVVGEPALAASVEAASAADGGAASSADGVTGGAPDGATGGPTTTTGDAATVLGAGPDWVLAAGEAALDDLVVEGIAVPVLVVGDAGGVPAVRRERATDAVEAVLSGQATRTTRRLFAAVVDGDRVATMLRDAMLITDEPARISEYAVRRGNTDVARFRADGVVVATPAGSQGYLAAAGGPVLEPGTGTLAAVPVAPFQTDSDHWVLDDAGVSLTVHRDEAVVLVVDGRETATVQSAEQVAFEPTGDLALFAVGGDWKNSNGRRPE